MKKKRDSLYFFRMKKKRDSLYFFRMKKKRDSLYFFRMKKKRDKIGGWYAGGGWLLFIHQLTEGDSLHYFESISNRLSIVST